MWRVTSNAPFGLNWGMLVNKWSLLIYVTLYASRIGACCQSRLFKFETTVRIVAIAAFHCAFQHLVMERQIKLVLGFAVTVYAKLRFAVHEQFHI